MVATLASIYHDEESLPIQRIYAKYRGLSARACWSHNNKSVTQPFRIYSLKGSESSHRDLSRKTMGSSLPPHDSPPITLRLSPFLSGTITSDAARKFRPRKNPETTSFVYLAWAHDQIYTVLMAKVCRTLCFVCLGRTMA